MSTIVYLLGLLLIVVVLFVLLYRTNAREINPGEELVIKNSWTGEPEKKDAGRHILRYFKDEDVQLVSVKDEPYGPISLKELVMADAVELKELKYNFIEFRVINSIKAATVIDYAQRKTLTEQKVAAFVQSELVNHSAESLFEEIEKETKEGEKRVVKKISKEKMKEVQRAVEEFVNKALISDIEAPWGIHSKVQVVSIDIPDNLSREAQQAATADLEGSRIKTTADAAGVPSWLIVLKDILPDILGGKRNE